MTPEQQTARIEELEATLYQCLPFFEDWRDENGIYKPNTMAFMIRLIRQSIGESIK